MSVLAGRRGLIVGFSGESSVAYHCAKAFAQQGAEVALTSRPERLEELRESAQAAGSRLHLGLDACDEESMRAAFGAMEAQWGSLDFVLHTLVHVPAGVLQQPLVDIERGDFQRVMEVGVLSFLRLAGLARPLLLKSDAPRIVTLSSESSHLATPHYHIAGIGKAALESACRYLALELGPHGILCNVLSFSALDSQGAGAAVGKDKIAATRAHLAKRAMTKRASEWQDVASSAAWLCSPMLQNVTGQKIVVDGGYTASYF